MEQKEHIRHYSQDDITRLKELVREGCTVMREVEDLNGGLNDTIKSIADEMQIKPGVLKKVVRTAYKQNMHEERSKFEELEDILQTLGLDK